jgi:hypothetical protein
MKTESKKFVDGFKTMNEIVRTVFEENSGGKLYEGLVESKRTKGNNTINEWEAALKFFDKLKAGKDMFSQKLIDWGNELLKKIVDAVVGALEKIKSLGEMIFTKLLEFFGMEFDKVNATLPYEDMIQG